MDYTPPPPQLFVESFPGSSPDLRPPLELNTRLEALLPQEAQIPQIIQTVYHLGPRFAKEHRRFFEVESLGQTNLSTILNHLCGQAVAIAAAEDRPPLLSDFLIVVISQLPEWFISQVEPIILDRMPALKGKAHLRITSVEIFVLMALVKADPTQYDQLLVLLEQVRWGKEKTNTELAQYHLQRAQFYAAAKERLSLLPQANPTPSPPQPNSGS